MEEPPVFDPQRQPAAFSPVHVIRRIAAGERMLGERMYVVGSGPVPIPGTVAGAVALRADGRPVFIVASDKPTLGMAAGIADYLDRMIQLGDHLLRESADPPRSVEQIKREHAEFHHLLAPRQILSTNPKAVLVTATSLPDAMWDEINSELDSDLEGAYVVDQGTIRPLGRPPPPERRGRVRRPPGWPAIAWLGIIGLLVGLGVTIVGVFGTYTSDRRTQPAISGPAILQSPLRMVATSVPVSATLAQWIGQQRAVTTSSGTLVLVYPSVDGLGIVSDHGNGGRTWRSSVGIPDIDAVSLSVAIDADDRLHLVASDEQSVRYYELIRGTQGWTVDAEVELDPATTRQTVDIAWDEEDQLAFVVWVGEGERGMQPKWAAISSATAEPTVVATRNLAPPDQVGPTLANVATLPKERVIVTYRRPGRVEGWYARIVDYRRGLFDWGSEETVPGTGAIGAASLEVDRYGTVHLALRDDSDTAIVYHRRTDKNGWTGGAVVQDGATVEETDFPSLSIDDRSRLVYVFYQTNAFIPTSTEVVVMIRDPVAGWEGPQRLAEEVPGGAVYPVAAGPSAQPMVFWTALGMGPAIQMARVAAP